MVCCTNSNQLLTEYIKLILSYPVVLPHILNACRPSRALQRPSASERCHFRRRKSLPIRPRNRQRRNLRPPLSLQRSNHDRRPLSRQLFRLRLLTNSRRPRRTAPSPQNPSLHRPQGPPSRLHPPHLRSRPDSLHRRPVRHGREQRLQLACCHQRSKRHLHLADYLSLPYPFPVCLETCRAYSRGITIPVPTRRLRLLARTCVELPRIRHAVLDRLFACGICEYDD